MKKIIAIVGARPQFIKHFSFEKACEGRIDLITIHTGQHFDENMSEIFFDQLGMQRPKYILKNGGGNHGTQTGKMMIDIEAIVENERPEGVVVYGDTNSTLAGALVAAKLHIPIYHIEAGLRSFNKDMPEEINRVLTDHISEKLFITSQVASENLQREGIDSGLVLVGDIMKDVVQYVVENGFLESKKVNFDYYYVTIHRPYNTDSIERLIYIFEELNKLSKKVIIALHPRTKKLAKQYQVEFQKYSNLIVIEPQSYFDNLSYLKYSNGLVTDSGGMQKEAYWLQKKCVTIRKETEWVETIELEGNHLLFDDLNQLEELLNRQPKYWDTNLYGDGNAGKRIVQQII
ncbi:non-hydrolyzing UDP-N-acetylglucosamine 2-epimerase [Capnocytophaga canis]|uniref:non-hydrolyzing UDP-N-acetylglucosamine 2-epimerase n=1 Tax=Capnocytophaga canis TaxID=1848903 RepID=UPI00370D5FEC